MNYLFGNKKLNQTLQKIISYKDMANDILIAGGVSIYINDNMINSKRRHHDFDFYVDIKNMPKIRTYMKELGATFLKDTLSHFDDDLGCDIIINDIKVELIPYQLKDNTIYVDRAYYNEGNDNWTFYRSGILKLLPIKEIFEKIKMYNNIEVKVMKKDFSYALKYYLYKYENIKRNKDKKDIAYLKNIINLDKAKKLVKLFIDKKVITKA